MRRKVAPENTSQKSLVTKALPAPEQNPAAIATVLASNQCLQFGAVLVPGCLRSSIPDMCHESRMSQPVGTSSSHPRYAKPAAL